MREFAFAPFEEGTVAAGQKPHFLFIRHRSLKDAGELEKVLSHQAPRHAYYSTAHYLRPDHPSMKEKGWEGADLVFDLDADHLIGAEGLNYQDQLELARKRFCYLLDEYIFGDFGLTESDVTLTFSGGRGYHAHIHSPPFQKLTGGERRELVDYAMGAGFEPLTAAFFPEGSERVEGSQARGRQYLRFYPTTAPGWKGRMSRGLHQWIEERANLSEEALALEVESLLQGEPTREQKGVPGDPGPSRKPSREAKAIAKDLVRPETQRAILEMQTLESFPHDRTGEKRGTFLTAMAKRLSVQLQGEMDAPVTTDVHRLIRMPGSLHGGTGFVVRPLTRGELDHFDPFRDALLPISTLHPGASGTKSTFRVELNQEVNYPFAEVPLRGKVGEKLDLPLSQALFLVLRAEAELAVA